MNHRMEVNVLLMNLSLPDGYRVREIQGRLYLFDPLGIPLHSPKDPALIEAYAWRHVWRHIEREVNEELADFRAGVRPLHSLRRLRQYMRMLDAAAEIPRVVERRPRSRRIVAWGAFVASAAAAAALLLLTSPSRFGPVPESTQHQAASSPPAVTKLAQQPAPAVPAEPGASRGARAARAVDTSRRGAAPAARHRPTLKESAVSFGAFVDRTAADTMMHLIRSKGYIVYVARMGEHFLVVTRPYHTRAQAARLVAALQEIGLPAQLTVSRGRELSSRTPHREELRGAALAEFAALRTR